MIDGDARLEDIRGALLAAAGADLAGSGDLRRQPRPRPRRNTRIKLAIALIVAVLAIPAGALAIRALAADHAPSLGHGVGPGLPASSMAMVGIEPSCITLRRNVEYDCLLAASPQEEPDAVAAGAGHWRGYVDATVDATDHVNGGCRAENVAGTSWHCFLGEAAVHHNLIAQGSLGDYRPGVA